MTPMKNLEAYFERIHFKGSPGISLETLQSLHVGQCLNIPFENLDIHLGHSISLEPDHLFEKMVHRNRGGYCYEMNGLFAYVLEELGFSVTGLMARVLIHRKPEPRNHQLLCVHVEGRDWLVDVGYGGRGLLAPIPLEDRQMEKQFADTIRLVATPDNHWILQTLIEETWEPQYEFNLAPYKPIDYMPGNYYHSTSPESLFTRIALCTMPTTDGFIQLRNQLLTITANGKSVSEKAHSLEEYHQLLKKNFNIELKGDLSPPW